MEPKEEKEGMTGRDLITWIRAYGAENLEVVSVDPENKVMFPVRPALKKGRDIVRNRKDGEKLDGDEVYIVL